MIARPDTYAAAPILAAIYLRVSTEGQDYSTRHQRTAITQYAAANGLSIIKEYIDEGKSGLDIRRRAGLRQLMLDVQSGEAPYGIIVVYDVSRWGRFQDVDEAAYHEHTCRRAGIRVVYCAEQFQSDGSPMAALLKGIKRTMAAEYSRELSAKVFVAQCRFVEMGFKQGGHAGFGLRRLSLAADGTPRRELAYGESKGNVTDRVVLVLGPAAEVATVRRIYALYIDDRLSEAEIARRLNWEGTGSEFGRPWTQAMVNSILTNPKYVGTLAYNRRSSKLSTKRQHNEPTDWIVKYGALPSLVPPATFEAAIGERARRNRRYSPDELLGLLGTCFAIHGRVTAAVIASEPSLPDPQLFKRAFGSLVNAYELAGLPRTRQYAFVSTRRRLAELQEEVFDEVCTLATKNGATVAPSTCSCALIINVAISTLVLVVPSRAPVRGRKNWAVKPRPGISFTIAACHDPASDTLIHFYLLPSQAFDGRTIYLKGASDKQFQQFRYDSLDAIFGGKND